VTEIVDVEFVPCGPPPTLRPVAMVRIVIDTPRPQAKTREQVVAETIALNGYSVEAVRRSSMGGMVYDNAVCGRYNATTTLEMLEKLAILNPGIRSRR
jgi:hypothetical protein